MLRKCDPREPKLWLAAVGLFSSSEKVLLNSERMWHRLDPESLGRSVGGR